MDMVIAWTGKKLERMDPNERDCIVSITGELPVEMTEEGIRRTVFEVVTGLLNYGYEKIHLIYQGNNINISLFRKLVGEAENQISGLGLVILSEEERGM